MFIITVRCKILKRENFGKFGELQVIQNFLAQNFLLWIIRSMWNGVDGIIEAFSVKNYL